MSDDIRAQLKGSGPGAGTGPMVMGGGDPGGGAVVMGGGAPADDAIVMGAPASASGGSTALGSRSGGLDARAIVLLVVLAPFAIAMVLGMLEHLKSREEAHELDVPAPGDMRIGIDA